MGHGETPCRLGLCGVVRGGVVGVGVVEAGGGRV